jgi:hypothetical protein
MPRKITEQEKRDYLQRFGYELIINVDGAKKITIKHIKCGRVYPVMFSDFKNKNSRCSKCAGLAKITEQEKREYLQRFGYELIRCVEGNKAKMIIKHIECGYVYPVSFNNFKHRNSRCTECAGLKRITEDDIREYVKVYSYELITYVEGDKSRVKQVLKHLKCRHVYPVRFSDFKHGERCPKCAHRIKTMEIDVRNYVEKNGYELIKFVLGDMGKVKQIIKHLGCGCIYPVTFKNFKNGSRCQKCSRLRSERLCVEIFENIFSGYKFLKGRPSFLNGLELDGYCEELKVAFEYNGIQHYEIGHVPYDTEEALKKRKMNDQTKIKLCGEQGIKLCVIPYTFNYQDPDILEAFIRVLVYCF